jgi:hypothetical protein
MAQQKESHRAAGKSTDSQEFAHHIEKKMEDIMADLRDQTAREDDPHAEALYETAAEVLGGLSKAFAHYAHKSEEAWR